MLVSLHNDGDENIELRPASQAITNGLRNLDIYSLLNLVIDHRLFTIIDLILKNENILLTADCVFVIHFLDFCFVMQLFKIC